MGCLARSRDRWVLVISSLRTCSLPEFLLTPLAAQPALAVRLLFSRVTGDSNSLPRAFPLPLTLRTPFWWCRADGPCALGLGQFSRAAFSLPYSSGWTLRVARVHRR